MQLKVPAKEALDLIEKRIINGDNLIDYIETRYESAEHEIKDLIHKKKQINNVEILKKKNTDRVRKRNVNSDVFKNTPIPKLNIPVLDFSSQIAEMQKLASRIQIPMPVGFQKSNNNEVISMKEQDVFYEKRINDFVEKKEIWKNSVFELFKNISGNYIDRKKLKNVSWKRYSTILLPSPYERDVNTKYSEYINIIREIEAFVSFLSDIYDELQKECKSPLSYIKDRSTLCYYDYVCELTADTNEALLCDYIFQFPIGSKKEVADIYKYITGDTYSKNKISVIKNAIESINKKTTKHFGFSIFQKEKLLLYVQVKH